MNNSIANKVFMVRPANFSYNEQTAITNPLMRSEKYKNVRSIAKMEFDNVVKVLRDNGIYVYVWNDTDEPKTPDAVFPNNWFCTLEDGTLVLFPMFAKNRRLERDSDAIQLIKRLCATNCVIDFSEWENKQHFLEGTGSMVLDRENKIAYACRSLRTSETVLNEFCKKAGFKPIMFSAVDYNGMPMYHTNVVMSIGSDFAVVCNKAFKDAQEWHIVSKSLTKCGKRIINITPEQMFNYAGNIIELKNLKGESVVLMSETAHNSFTEEQLSDILSGDKKLAVVSIPTIEKVGGGSARCMVAELF